MTSVRLVSIIGHGSFGTVYRAVYRGSVVAAKVVQVGEESKSVIGEVEKCRLAGMVSSTMYILCFKLVIIIVTWLLQASSTPQCHTSDGIPHTSWAVDDYHATRGWRQLA